MIQARGEPSSGGVHESGRLGEGAGRRRQMRSFAAIGCLVLTVGPMALLAGAGGEGQGAVHGVSGSYTYRTYCASCHGKKGKGDGPLAESLRFHPPDLTLLAERNGGEYPKELVERIIDGRKAVEGHGGPDMPVWGDAFKNTETGFDEEKVKQKIRSVVDYLKTLQE
jgi:mono/diheme cytochrome c family protein